MQFLEVDPASTFSEAVLTPLEYPDNDADPQLVNELHGFVMRCATYSRYYGLDFAISRASAIAIAGTHDRAKALINLALAAGSFRQVEVDANHGSSYVVTAPFLRRTNHGVES